MLSLQRFANHESEGDPTLASRALVGHMSKSMVITRMVIENTRDTDRLTAMADFPLREQECLRALSFPEQEHRLDDIPTAVDTCEWLSGVPEYQDWMKRTTGLFWIRGDPGAGKSVLMKHSFKRMHESSVNDLVVSFFFHGQGTPLQKTLLGLFRALLASMLEYFPEHLTQLAVKYAEREKRYGGFSERRWDWTEKELQELLSSVLKSTHCQPVVIFIDALDECGEGPARRLLSYFKDLTFRAESARFRICLSSRHYPILALDTIPAVQVEKSNSKDIQTYVQRELRDIQPRSKRDQIETEILSKSNGGFQWAFLVTKSIVDENLIGIKAEKLLEQLNSCPRTLGEIYEALFHSVPATYQHQMTKIFQWVRFAERPLSAQELRDALAIDQEMSQRTMLELRAYEGWSDSLTDFERYVKHISRGLICFQSREIWEQYDPTGEDSDREAQLIHQSVADFLMDKFVNSARSHGPMVPSSAGPSHFQISRSCLKYMTLEEILDDAHLPRNTLSSRYPLAPYAVRSLFAHIRKVEQEGILQSDLPPAMQWMPDSKKMRKLATLWRTLDPDSLHTPLGWPFIGATSLHVLVAFGSMSAIDVLFESGCDDIDSMDADGNTPLMLAIREGHQNIALALLDRSIECEGRHEPHEHDGGRKVTDRPVLPALGINAHNQDGDTALSIALEDQRMGEVIIKLIESGADLKYLGRETALVAYAISSRNTKLLSILIERKLDLDGALFFALQDQLPQGDPILDSIISQLLDAGANTTRSLVLNHPPQPEDDDDEEEDESDGRYDSDALALASRRGFTGVIEMLLAHKASATLQNDRGECPLYIATINGHERVVEMLLLEAPSSVETANHENHTAVSIALFTGKYEILKLLLRGGSFSGHNPDLKRCFIDSSRNGVADVVEIILQRDLVDVNSTDNDGTPALCLAAQNGYAAVVQQLLNTGKVDPDSTDNDERTALSWAAENGHAAVVQPLLDTGKIIVDWKDNNGWSTLSWVARMGFTEVLRMLLNTGRADVNLCGPHQRTALWWAVSNGHEAAVKLLIDQDAVDVNAKDMHGSTPLLCALQNRRHGIATLLLETNRIDMSIRDENGWTPLWWAVMYRDETAVKLLVDQDLLDVNAKWMLGLTPLLWAVQNKCHSIVTLLLATNKIDISIKDMDEWPPLSWATQHRQDDIAQLLLEYRSDNQPADTRVRGDDSTETDDDKKNRPPVTD